MGEPELFKNLIPENVLNKINGTITSQTDFSERFSMVIRGYERFNLQQFFSEYRYEFEMVLQDLIKCIQCDGNCKSSIYTKGGTHFYQGLDSEAILAYKTPMFKAFYCPGVTERKLQIKRQLSNGEIIENIQEENIQEKSYPNFANIQKSNLVSLEKIRRQKEEI